MKVLECIADGNIIVLWDFFDWMNIKWFFIPLFSQQRVKKLYVILNHSCFSLSRSHGLIFFSSFIADYNQCCNPSNDLFFNFRLNFWLEFGLLKRLFKKLYHKIKVMTKKSQHLDSTSYCGHNQWKYQCHVFIFCGYHFDFNTQFLK